MPRLRAPASLRHTTSTGRSLSQAHSNWRRAFERRRSSKKAISQVGLPPVGSSCANTVAQLTRAPKRSRARRPFSGRSLGVTRCHSPVAAPDADGPSPDLAHYGPARIARPSSQERARRAVERKSAACKHGRKWPRRLDGGSHDDQAHIQAPNSALSSTPPTYCASSVIHPSFRGGIAQ